MQLQITHNATKTDLLNLANKTITDISEFGKPIESAEILTKMEFLIDSIKKNKDFIEMVRTELEKDGKSIVTPTGTKIELCEAGTKYHYDKCQDPVWNELNDKLKEIKAQISQREDLLKALPDEGMQAVTNDGELVTIFKASKTSTSTFKTTLAK